MLRPHLGGLRVPYMIDQQLRGIAPAYLSFGPYVNDRDAALLIAACASTMRGDNLGRCRVGPIRWSKETAWLFSAFRGVVLKAVDHAYPFTYAGFAEPLVLTRYDAEEGSAQDWRMSANTGATSARKMTLVCELSQPADYEGSQLQIFGPTGQRSCDKQALGVFTVFPAYAPHRVTPITSGVRWTVTGHLAGPPFV